LLRLKFLWILACSLNVLLLILLFIAWSDAEDKVELTIGNVNLGELWPYEKRVFYVKVANNSSAAAHLERPKADCGCISSQVGSVDILPGDEFEFPFIIVAGNDFGPFEKNILFNAICTGEQALRARIVGEVRSDILCNPSSISFLLGSMEETQLTIREVNPGTVDIGQLSVVETTNDGEIPLVQIREIPSSEGSPVSERHYLVKVSGIQGRSSLEVVRVEKPGDEGRSSKVFARIPIDIQASLGVRTIPKSIQLGRFVDLGPEFFRTVALLSDQVSLRECLVTSLVDWASVECDVLTEKSARLRIAFDRDAMPDEIKNLPVLEISTPSGPLILKAYGYRP